MARYQDPRGRQSALQGLLKIFTLSTSPTLLPNADEDAVADVDEPPDSMSSQAQTASDKSFPKSPRLPLERMESLLTKALHPSDVQNTAESRPNSSGARGVSSASMHSATSPTSIADLSSDGLTSPALSGTPSPPLPPQYKRLPTTSPAKVNFDNKTSLPALAEVPEGSVEVNLGRKRCITFACARKSAPKPEEKPKQEAPATVELPKRKCMLTFACPSRNPSSENTLVSEPRKKPAHHRPATPPPSPVLKPVAERQTKVTEKKEEPSDATPRRASPVSKSTKVDDSELSEATRFHEFATSDDEDDAWVKENLVDKRKLTISDFMKKEYAIRQIGEEAEEEAEEDEREADEMDDEYEDEDQEDDFAPSEGESDAGNESDNEEGFADSDDESEEGSDDIFWAPSTTTAATSTDQIDHIRPVMSRRGSSSSMVSQGSSIAAYPHHAAAKYQQKRRSSKMLKMRPGTPDLPDSTDFVCGTLDEDRPLEAAYISCMEQRKRAKHVLIPQDIDPSFPTTDPEDNVDDNESDDQIEDDEPQWLKGQFDEIDNEQWRGRRKSSVAKHAAKKSPAPSPKRYHSPAPKSRVHHSPAPKSRVHRSPPAPQRRLFGQSPRRLRSPPPGIRIKSPPGTRRTSLTTSPRDRTPVGITITRLAQRPTMNTTASLPHSPNPYFRNYRATGEETAGVSITPTPGHEDDNRDRHVRGAVDIVIGLEKKRQKRKEKFWRQHCRKVAKEQAERKTIPGKGAERMKELGLVCAERSRGYGLGQQAQLVLSL